ncbi:Protein of unknown function DUF4307 [Candidatus Nanopelagicaceae bacterium]|jgi:hypothetical protein
MSYNESQFDYNDRYGIKPKSAWVKYAVTLLVAGVAWVAWAGLHYARPALSQDLISFENSDPRNPTIRYSINREDGNAVVICTLTARDFDKNVVGQVDDVIEAGDNSLERNVAIPTRADAVNVGITRCRIR